MVGGLQSWWLSSSPCSERLQKQRRQKNIPNLDIDASYASPISPVCSYVRMARRLEMEAEDLERQHSEQVGCHQAALRDQLERELESTSTCSPDMLHD